MTDALAPWDSGSAYLNFAEEKVDPAKFYPASNYERLRRVKAEVDPDRPVPRQPRNLRGLTG